MLDPDTVILCTACLAGAAIELPSAEDRRLTAIAFARDLTDAGVRISAAAELIDAAYAAAASEIDASALDATEFAAVMRRLVGLRDGVLGELVGLASGEAETVASDPF